MWFKKLIKKLWIYLCPYLNWRFVLCYFIPWCFTNGWAWVGTILLPIIGPNWFTITATSWMAILWMPWMPENIVIIPIAMLIHRKLFKNDEKTQQQLKAMYAEAKKDWNKIKNIFRRNKK